MSIILVGNKLYAYNQFFDRYDFYNHFDQSTIYDHDHGQDQDQNQINHELYVKNKINQVATYDWIININHKLYVKNKDDTHLIYINQTNYQNHILYYHNDKYQIIVYQSRKIYVATINQSEYTLNVLDYKSFDEHQFQADHYFRTTKENYYDYYRNFRTFRNSRILETITKVDAGIDSDYDFSNQDSDVYFIHDLMTMGVFIKINCDGISFEKPDDIISYVNLNPLILTFSDFKSYRLCSNELNQWNFLVTKFDSFCDIDKNECKCKHKYKISLPKTLDNCKNKKITIIALNISAVLIIKKNKNNNNNNNNNINQFICIDINGNLYIYELSEHDNEYHEACKIKTNVNPYSIIYINFRPYHNYDNAGCYIGLLTFDGIYHVYYLNNSGILSSFDHETSCWTHELVSYSHEHTSCLNNDMCLININNKSKFFMLNCLAKQQLKTVFLVLKHKKLFAAKPIIKIILEMSLEHRLS